MLICSSSTCVRPPSIQLGAPKPAVRASSSVQIQQNTVDHSILYNPFLFIILYIYIFNHAIFFKEKQKNTSEIFITCFLLIALWNVRDIEYICEFCGLSLCTLCVCASQVPLMLGINKTIEYFAQELKRKKHSERTSWVPDFI